MRKPKINADGTISVRIKASGQEIDMVQAAAFPMLYGGTAEALQFEGSESMTVEPAAERAVAPAQAGPAKKSNASKRKA